MRLWSIHPKYLDAKGLVALWREGLLAYAVLRGKTRGYTHHPQLERFRHHPQPLNAITVYLHAVCDEADRRGYRFDRTKLGRKRSAQRSRVTKGQLHYEFRHLKRKLRKRDGKTHQGLRSVKIPATHPLFTIVEGGIESWERQEKSRAPRKGT